MKTFVVLSCLVALAWSAPADPSIRRLPALRHEEFHDGHGQYAVHYITADNTVVSERGHLVPTASGAYVPEVEGQYEYVGDDGRTYVTRYRGGLDGFHVSGDHLPQPVPVPGVA